MNTMITRIIKNTANKLLFTRWINSPKTNTTIEIIPLYDSDSEEVATGVRTTECVVTFSAVDKSCFETPHEEKNSETPVVS